VVSNSFPADRSAHFRACGVGFMSCHANITIPRPVKAIIYGQLISLFVTGTGVCSQLLAQNYNINIPTTQSFLNYALLGLVYGIYLFVIKREDTIWNVLKTKTYIYLPLAFIDVEANYLGMYRITSTLAKIKNAQPRKFSVWRKCIFSNSTFVTFILV
jgi:hypothetical protein